MYSFFPCKNEPKPPPHPTPLSLSLFLFFYVPPKYPLSKAKATLTRQCYGDSEGQDEKSASIYYVHAFLLLLIMW